MRSLWDDPNHVFNSEQYRDKLSEAMTTKRNDPNGSWKDFSDQIKALWADPNHIFNSKEYCDKMIEVSKEYWSDCEAKGEAIHSV